MTPAILRTVLVIAVVLGVGVIANVFSHQQSVSQLSGPRPAGSGAEQPTATKMTAAVAREAERRQTVDGVRRQLLDRGYLPSALASAPGESLPVRAAILAFEFDYDLELTATPSDALLEALIFTHARSGARTNQTAASATARSIITEVQRALANLGYGAAEKSGELDLATRSAITKFERARGLQASGRISAPLIESLGPALDKTAVDLDGLGAGLKSGTRPTAG